MATSGAHCTACGAALEAGVRFCNACGTGISAKDRVMSGQGVFGLDPLHGAMTADPTRPEAAKVKWAYVLSVAALLLPLLGLVGAYFGHVAHKAGNADGDRAMKSALLMTVVGLFLGLLIWY